MGGSEPLQQSQNDLNSIKDLSEGTIVISFDSARSRINSYRTDTFRTPFAIFSASNSQDDTSQFCFCVFNGPYGAYAHENGTVLNDVMSWNTAYEAGRITAVLSVSQSSGTFLMTSQDLDATQRDSSMKSFFSAVSDLDTLLIGANKDSSGNQWVFAGTVYFVEVYSSAFTEEQAEAKIKETYLPFSGGVSYVRTNDRTFEFTIQPLGIGNSNVTYRWVFPGGDTSSHQSPTWTAPTGDSDPFNGHIPAIVLVTATISSEDERHGFAETIRLYIAPSASSGTVGRPPYFESMVFRWGDEEGFSCYRIPAIIRAGNGDLLAFAEARAHPEPLRISCLDFAHSISVVMKRSVDNGMTWGPLKVVARNILPTTGRQWVAQNPTAVLDMLDPNFPDGKIVIVYNETEYDTFTIKNGRGIRRTITAWSGDHGHTWHRNKIDVPPGTHDGDITNQVHLPHNPQYTAVYSSNYARANYNNRWPYWTFTSPTLGNSIQLERGPSSTRGRLLITGMVADRRHYNRFEFLNYVYWSDDHGETWQKSDWFQSGTHYLNEARSVELENGDILISSRAFARAWHLAHSRMMTRASFNDSGSDINFGTPVYTSVLSRTGVATGLTRITATEQEVFGSKSRIAYSYPQSPTPRRQDLSLRMSTNEGMSWDAYGSDPKLLIKGASAYSDIIGFPDARVGVLHESSHTLDFYEGGLLFSSASLNWLSDGSDQRALIRQDGSVTSFDGSSEFIDLKSSVGEVKDLAEGSVLATFKTTGDADQTLFSVSNSGEVDSYWSLKQTADGSFGVFARNGGRDVNVTTFNRELVTDGLWHRMAVTVGPDGTEIYVDGQHLPTKGQSTDFFSSIDGLSSMNLGRVVTSDGSQGFWTGSIGTVEIFDGVLTEDQAISATQPPAMPVAAFHVGKDLTAENVITVGTGTGGDRLVSEHLPQWVCNELAGSWAIGATFTAPDNVADRGTVFHLSDALSIASLRLGIWDTADGERIGLQYDGPDTSDWNMSVPFNEYREQEVSVIAVMGPVESYLVINGERVRTESTPVPEGPPVWHPANTTIGTTAHALDTHLKSVAIWKGIVPSEHLAKSLTLTQNITR